MLSATIAARITPSNHLLKNPPRMKKLTLLAFMLLALGGRLFASADFDIKKVDVQFVTTPEYQVNPPAKQVRGQKWMVIEVSFDAKPDFTDALEFNYYVLFAKRLFVGHITHVSIQKGRELHSVAYLSPKAIAQILEGRQPTASDLENVSVTIGKPGISAPISAKSWKPSNGDWWASMKQEDGFVLNKSETPFAPLAWDYYEALKPAGAR